MSGDQIEAERRELYGRLNSIDQRLARIETKLEVVDEHQRILPVLMLDVDRLKEADRRRQKGFWMACSAAVAAAASAVVSAVFGVKG